MYSWLTRTLASRGEATATAGLFLALVLLGLALHADYGVGWDEQHNATYGQITLDHVLGSDRSSHHFNKPTDFWHPVSGQFARTHGAVYEVLLVALTGRDDTPERIELRHLLVYLTLVLGAFFFHLLCRRVFGSWKMGLLGAALLMLHPRIFAHGFHNSMDIGFLVAFTACMLTLLRALERRRVVDGCLHGAACAVLVDIRIAGMIMPAITAAFVLLEVIAAPSPRARLRQMVLPGVGFAALFVPLVVLLWPMLWSDPLANFLQAFGVSSHDPWQWWELYLGQKVQASEVPWHFTPVWMAVTTPPLLTALALTGLGWLLASARPSRAFYRQHRGPLLALCCLGLPLAAVALLGATLFNGWRHMYFVYPGFLVLALYALDRAAPLIRARLARPRRRAAHVLLAAAVAAGMTPAACFMVRAHPHQIAYFNVLTGGLPGARGTFQTGYWGPEYREGLEQLLAIDRPEGCCIKLYMSKLAPVMSPVHYNVGALPEPRRRWFQFTQDVNTADYFLSNFCDHIPAKDYTEHGLTELWSRKVDGVKVIALYRMKRKSQASP